MPGYKRNGHNGQQYEHEKHNRAANISGRLGESRAAAGQTKQKSDKRHAKYTGAAFPLRTLYSPKPRTISVVDGFVLHRSHRELHCSGDANQEELERNDRKREA
jgi:hypothetical protein